MVLTGSGNLLIVLSPFLQTSPALVIERGFLFTYPKVASHRQQML
jgi:hypothetical protein